MAVTNPVGTWVDPNFQVQTGTAYKTNLDNTIKVAKRLNFAFGPHEQATPNMTVRLDAGYIFTAAGALTEVAAQSTVTITAPTTNPRIDRVVIDRVTGAVSVITGTEAASPTPPAITVGKLPVAQVLLQTSTTTITNQIISDERLAIGSPGEFSSGVVMVFFQAAAPTGWTQVTTHNDKALRVVSGAGGGSGGSQAFSTHSHTIPSEAAHGHSLAFQAGGLGLQSGADGVVVDTGGSHSHGGSTGNATLQFIDVIVASKN